MTESRKCPHCGAHVPRADARFCEFCGTELPRVAPPAAPALSPGELPLAARLAAARNHADLAELMLREPSVAAHLARGGCGVAGLVVFVLVAAGMTFFFARISAGSGIPMWIVPLFMVGFGLILLVKAISRGADLASAPLERRVAAVVEKRTEIEGSGDSTRTHHFATLEGEDGSRREFKLEGRLSGLLSKHDVGVAYTRTDVLLDFQRLK